MPLAAAHQVRRPGFEVDHHLVIVVALQDGKTVAQVLVRVEVLGLLEALVCQLRIGQPGEGEGPHGLPVRVVGEQVPGVLDAGQVVRVDLLGLELLRTEDLILER